MSAPDVTEPGPASGVNPYCESNEHALYVGCVCGIAVRLGLWMEFVDDDKGVHTDRLLMRLPGKVEIEFIVPPPPEGWTLEAWLPKQ